MIVIKDMEMPKCCHWDCPLCNEDGGACMLGAYDIKTDTKKERARNCPLVEIKEPKTDGDCISRQAVLKFFATHDGKYLYEAIRDMPSVKQEQKAGHWILDETDNSITCDKCGCLIWANDISNGEAYYCPNCGCRMVEPQENDHKCHTCKHYTSGENDGSCGSYICKEYSNWESEG